MIKNSISYQYLNWITAPPLMKLALQKMELKADSFMGILGGKSINLNKL